MTDMPANETVSEVSVANPREVYDQLQAERDYTLECGLTIRVKRVNSLLLWQMSEAAKREAPVKPEPPIVQGRQRNDGTFELESNPDDPDFQADLESYDQRLKHHEGLWEIKGVNLVLELGVITMPPPQYALDMADYIGNVTPIKQKVFWLFQHLSGELEAFRLREFIIGSEVITESGVAESLDQFRTDGRQASGEAVSVPSPDERDPPISASE